MRFAMTASRTLAALASLAFGVPAAANIVNAPHVQAELVAEYAALQPGENTVALRLAPDPGWHTYWRQPGDSGLPTTIQWTLPDDVTAGDIQWPSPQVFHLGDQVNYGYDHETLHLVTLTVPAKNVGEIAILTARASWLVCSDICIPGQAALSLALPVRESHGAPTRWAGAFAQTRAHLSPPGPATPAGSPLTASPGTGPAATSILAAIAFALLGGLILNLMPCVFPVLSIKAVSVMEAHGGERRQQRAHALAYTAGAVLSCLVAAGAILTLRAMGESLGWGFQLQSPVFVAVIAYLLFALALSMSGVVQFGTSIMGVGQSLAVRGGYAGSFFTGVLAVVVASPCTAPFMGTAIGFALTQPSLVAVSIFASLGVGLALPFLAIGFVPALGRLLPRPGAWMETFKQAMAFPLYLTVVWLVWVLARQVGITAVPVVLAGLVFVALASWLMSLPGIASRGLRYAALSAAVGLLFVPALHAPAADAATRADWEPYSDARLEQLRAGGKPVFVDLTADWCITCKFNERVAIDTDAVRAAFSQRGVALLRGDWTRADPAITQVLSRFDRAGVPLYLLYVPQRDRPVVLPQLLTKDTVLTALDQLP